VHTTLDLLPRFPTSRSNSRYQAAFRGLHRPLQPQAFDYFVCTRGNRLGVVCTGAPCILYACKFFPNSKCCSVLCILSVGLNFDDLIHTTNPNHHPQTFSHFIGGLSIVRIIFPKTGKDANLKF
jgi:hypothetical protein